jgi:Na+/melibiose symporter-like transporter
MPRLLGRLAPGLDNPATIIQSALKLETTVNDVSYTSLYTVCTRTRTRKARMRTSHAVMSHVAVGLVTWLCGGGNCVCL